MKINSTNFARLDLPEFYEFSERFIKLVKTVGVEKLKIEFLYNNNFLKAFQKFDDSYKIIKKSALTQKINELDKERDKITSSMIGTVKVSLNDMNQEVAKASKELKILFDEYKGIAKGTLKEQTGNTTNLLQSLKGKYAKHCTKLGLEKWISELERLNEEIRSNMHIRSEERGEKGKANAGKAKKEVIAAYKMICNQIGIYVTTEGVANYESFIRTLNAIIGEFGGSGITTGTTGGASEPPVVPSAEPTEPEDPFANAREWTRLIKAGDFKLGDIFYIAEPNVPKKYYELIDEELFYNFPNSDEGTLAWKRLV